MGLADRGSTPARGPRILLFAALQITQLAIQAELFLSTHS